MKQSKDNPMPQISNKVMHEAVVDSLSFTQEKLVKLQDALSYVEDYNKKRLVTGKQFAKYKKSLDIINENIKESKDRKKK